MRFGSPAATIPRLFQFFILAGGQPGESFCRQRIQQGGLVSKVTIGRRMRDAKCALQFTQREMGTVALIDKRQGSLQQRIA